MLLLGMLWTYYGNQGRDDFNLKILW